jgi:hypothetical protein
VFFVIFFAKEKQKSRQKNCVYLLITSGFNPRLLLFTSSGGIFTVVVFIHFITTNPPFPFPCSQSISVLYSLTLNDSLSVLSVFSVLSRMIREWLSFLISVLPNDSGVVPLITYPLIYPSLHPNPYILHSNSSILVPNS